MSAAPLCFEREQVVRFGHCDPAGIVFFPQYLVMLNELVEDWFDRGLQLPYAQVVGERRVGLPTVRLEVDFTAISRMGDRLTQQLRLRRLGSRSATLEVDYRAGDELRLRARQVLVCTSLHTHQSQAWPADVRQAMQAFIVPEDPVP